MRVQYFTYLGETGAAIEAVFPLLRAGKKYQLGSGVLIEGLTSIAIFGLAIDGEYELLRSDEISINQIDQLNNELLENRLARSDFADCYRREYQISKNTVLTAFEKDLKIAPETDLRMAFFFNHNKRLMSLLTISFDCRRKNKRGSPNPLHSN